MIIIRFGDWSLTDSAQRTHGGCRWELTRGDATKDFDENRLARGARHLLYCTRSPKRQRKQRTDHLQSVKRTSSECYNNEAKVCVRSADISSTPIQQHGGSDLNTISLINYQAKTRYGVLPPCLWVIVNHRRLKHSSCGLMWHEQP